MQPSYEATCLEQPMIAGVAGADSSAICKFRNTGKIAWPQNVQLKLVDRTVVQYRALGLLNQSVQPYEYISITIEVKLPETLGKYLLNFRLTHGDGIPFGDAFSVSVVTQSRTDHQVSSSCKSIEYNVQCSPERPLVQSSGDSDYVDLNDDGDGAEGTVSDRAPGAVADGDGVPGVVADSNLSGNRKILVSDSPHTDTGTMDTMKGSETPDTAVKKAKKARPPPPVTKAGRTVTPKKKEVQRHTSTN